MKNKYDFSPNFVIFTLLDIISLRYLDLSNNELKKIPDEIFKNLSSIETLLLQGNPLEYLNRDTFRNMSELKTLDLIETEIDDFPPELTQENYELVTLWLDRNHLTEVPELTHLKTLELVRLSQNPIEFIRQGDFSQLPHLGIFEMKLKRFIRSGLLLANCYYNLL